MGRGVDINFSIPQKGMWMGTSQPTGFVCWNLPCSLGIYVYFGAKYPHFAAQLVSPYVDICCASAWSQLLWRTSTGRKFQTSNWFHMTYENPSYQIESFDLLKTIVNYSLISQFGHGKSSVFFSRESRNCSNRETFTFCSHPKNPNLIGPLAEPPRCWSKSRQPM